MVIALTPPSASANIPKPNGVKESIGAYLALSWSALPARALSGSEAPCARVHGGRPRELSRSAAEGRLPQFNQALARAPKAGLPLVRLIVSDTGFGSAATTARELRAHPNDRLYALRRDRSSGSSSRPRHPHRLCSNSCTGLHPRSADSRSLPRDSFACSRNGPASTSGMA